MPFLVFFSGGLCLIPFVLVMFGLILVAATTGIDAATQAWNTKGTRAATWWFVTLHLYEPLVNTFLIYYRSRTVFDWSDWSPPGVLARAVSTTAPMVILLLPALGLTFRNEADRDVCAVLTRQGMIRWLLTLGVFSATFGGLLGVDVLLLIIGCGYLWWCVEWSKELLFSHGLESHPE